MNKKGIIMWFILAGFFILLLTSLGIYIRISGNGLEIGLKSELVNGTAHKNLSNSGNLNNISIIEIDNNNSINNNYSNNSLH